MILGGLMTLIEKDLNKHLDSMNTGIIGIGTIIDLVIIEMKGMLLGMKGRTIEEIETGIEDIAKDLGQDLNHQGGATTIATMTVKDQESIDVCKLS